MGGSANYALRAGPAHGRDLLFRHEPLHNQLAIEALLWVGRRLMRFQVQLFEEVAPALGWLVDGDLAAAQSLQAEWNAAWPHLPLSI